MKKGILKIAFIAVSAMSFASCAMVQPICATSNPVGSKRGEAVDFRICCIPISSAGIDAAAKNGGITKISHVEQRSQLLWPLIGKSKTIVYGE